MKISPDTQPEREGRYDVKITKERDADVVADSLQLQIVFLQEGGIHLRESVRPGYAGGDGHRIVLFEGQDAVIDGKPYVGCGVLGSAVAMDKDVARQVMTAAGLSTPRWEVVRSSEFADDPAGTVERITRSLGNTVFVKPASLGSSVGISKVESADELGKAVRLAFEYDNKILVEEYIQGREIECSVLGNDNPIVSVPGEIIPQHEFYSYEAKYIDENGAVFDIPARLSDKTTKKVQDYAIKTFRVICCEGMARVDFFLKDNDEIIVNEINTIPGFTKISMYPKLWEASGISYSKLIDRLIELAIERFKSEQELGTDAFESQV